MTVFSESTPISFRDSLPDTVDVVVIGGGVIGMSTAYFLAERGVSVLVCEKGRVAGEQSSRNWGWVRQQGRDAAELPIMMESMRIWRGLGERTGEDLGFAQEGALYLAETESELEELSQWLDIARRHQLDTRLLTAVEVDRLITDKPGQWVGALYTPSDGRAEPWQAVPGLARAAQRAGARIIENCAVRTVDMQAGRVAGVVTESGIARTDAVVCAAGAWSSMFARNLGIDLPQLTIKSTVACTRAAPDVCAGNAVGGNLAFRRRKDGGYTIAVGDYHEHFVSADSFRYFGKFLKCLGASYRDIGVRFGGDLWQRLRGPGSWSGDDETPFERTRVLNPAPSRIALDRMRRRLAERLPSLADIPFAESWAGMIDATPDIVPVMDEVPGHRGFFVATGFSGHGFGIGPGAGKVMADLVQGNPPGHDLTRFRYSRFFDGSAITLGPAL